MTWLVAALVGLLLAVALLWSGAPALAARSRALIPLAPLAVAVMAALSAWNAWGSLDPIPSVGDEAAYVLQASLLARGRIAGDAAPLPQFFEQAHVLVTPKLAPKYPLGFGLVLVPGTLLGAPALIPLLLVGLTGALLFSLARRFFGAATALLASSIWIAAPGGRYRSGFFSETLTGATCLVAWYALARWREQRALGWLVVVSLSLALAAITRPLTALVFALPVAFIVLRDSLRLRSWRPVVISALVAMPVIGILPLQDAAAGGPWWQMPYGRYTREYLPFDHLGFGLDETAPLRTRPPDIERLAQAFATFHRDYSLSRVPFALVGRLRVFFDDLTGGWALAGFILTLISLIRGPASLRFAAGTGLLLFLAHLGYAHPPQWSLYYAEALPIGAATTAVGALMLVGWGMQRAKAVELVDRRAFAAIVLSFAALWPLPDRLAVTRINLDVAREPLERFNEATASINGPAVVFVRYALGERMHRSLIRNPADYATAPIWTVYDRGVENAQLMALAPGRTAYLFDERSGQMAPLDVAQPTAAEPAP